VSAAAPIRVRLLDSDEGTAVLLRALLGARLEHPVTIELAAENPPAAERPAYDIWMLDCDLVSGVLQPAHISGVRRALVQGGSAPLVLASGSRSRAIELALLAAGAADVIWKEELSAPLLESQVRHALEARQRAILERQFHESQKLETVGRIAGGIAHDFNNILTAVVGFGSLVAEQVVGNEDAERNVAEILRAAERAAVLSQQLSSIGLRPLLHPTRLDLDETVQGVAALVARLAGDDIEVRVSGPSDLPPISGDRSQIESAILNLAMNARDAMPHGGRLTIETRRVDLDDRYCFEHSEVLPGHYVRLSVSDTGGGLSRHEQDRIFDRFSTSTGSVRVNDLGLAAVRGIVKQSGGHILVYSEPGIGTTFKLYLPVDETAAARIDPSVGPTDWSRGTGTILLVEDTSGIRRLMAGVLRGAGYQVLEASHSGDAVAVMAAHGGNIDLLLTDVVMPGGSGIDLAAEMVGCGSIGRVLFMSGFGESVVDRLSVAIGDSSFIQKPFTPTDLLRKVAEVVGACSEAFRADRGPSG
jgi:signal transduction histidine kinase/ActR/RegA family two-component response regulator